MSVFRCGEREYSHASETDCGNSDAAESGRLGRFSLLEPLAGIKLPAATSKHILTIG